ncbi:MAG: hypothetical protein MUC34_20595 [Anaerolineae bacterium]|jgi:hypothetical protein|nr:hypothetical protein [Anaerolineae bacterium]
MDRIRHSILALLIVLAVGLVGWPPAAVSADAPVASFQRDDGGGDKGKDDKDNGKGAKDNKKDDKNKGNNGNGNGQGNSAGPNNESVSSGGPGRGLGAWLRDFRSRFLPGRDDDRGGWQLGRFKDAFPFAYPPGWRAVERGDALALTGTWQGAGYLFQLTRATQVDHGSLRDWVGSELGRLGLPSGSARFVDAGRTQVAVITGVKDASYTCPVAYVYLWTENPAGNNDRQAFGLVSQERGAACNTAALNSLIDQYLARIGQGQTPAPMTTRPAGGASSPPVPAPAAGTATPQGAGWQSTRFFNAFSFAYPSGWSMDRLGDTAHLQGNYEGRGYVMDVVWVRTTPQNGIEQWVRADLADLGALNGARIDYVGQPGAQIAIAPAVRMAGYGCPVVRFYVLADNPAGDGPRAFSGTLAQANGQACDPAGLENLAYQMLRQA